MSNQDSVYSTTISSTSPIISYSPSGYSSVSTGWTTYYSKGIQTTSDGRSRIGSGTAYRITSYAGAEMRLDFYGSGLTIYGTNGGRAYDVIFDKTVYPGQPNGTNLASFQNLTLGNHEVVLRIAEDTQGQNGLFYFEKIVTAVDSGLVGTSLSQTTVDDLDSRITYVGSGWQRTISPYLQTSDRGIHQAVYYGETASLQFQGFSISGYGNLDMNHGLYDVTVDSATPVTFNGSSTEFVGPALLFRVAGLDVSATHRMVITNLQNAYLDLDYFVIESASDANGSTTQSSLPSPTSSIPSSNTNTNPNSSRSSKNLGAIVGGVLGLVAVILLTIALLLFLRSRRNRRLSLISGGAGLNGPSERGTALSRSTSSFSAPQRSSFAGSSLMGVLNREPRVQPLPRPPTPPTNERPTAPPLSRSNSVGVGDRFESSHTYFSQQRQMNQQAIDSEYLQPPPPPPAMATQFFPWSDSDGGKKRPRRASISLDDLDSARPQAGPSSPTTFNPFAPFGTSFVPLPSPIPSDPGHSKGFPVNVEEELARRRVSSLGSPRTPR